jgi:hypothetical protein
MTNKLPEIGKRYKEITHPFTIKKINIDPCRFSCNTIDVEFDNFEEGTLMLDDYFGDCYEEVTEDELEVDDEVRAELQEILAYYSSDLEEQLRDINRLELKLNK